MLGASLITEQTGPVGQPVSKVLILKGINFDRELYFAILLDRTHDGVVVVASEMGGMDIEKVFGVVLVVCVRLTLNSRWLLSTRKRSIHSRSMPNPA
jgi:succinyl-CoA synthetase beta subunit